MKYLPNLNPLRFILAFFVILYHIPLICNTLKIPAFSTYPLFHKGTLAVYYFFTLSGFLILRQVFLELKDTDKFNFKHFYARRIERLYPVYYFILIIGILTYHVVLPKIGIIYAGHYSLKNLLLDYVFFFPNIFTYYNRRVGSILIILWSIGVEEQFYIFMPVFLFLFKKKIMPSMYLLLILLVLTLLFFPSLFKYGNYYFYFAAGGLFGCLSLKSKINFFYNKYFHFTIYALFILSFTSNYFELRSLFFSHIFNMLISSFLIALIADYPIFIFRNDLIDYFGKISYGIYMYHMVIITGVLFIVSKTKVYVYIYEGVFIVLLNLIIVTLTILTAHLSYKYFESIFYTKKKQINLSVNAV